MGYQDFGQLEQRYGDSLSRIILSNCATKAFLWGWLDRYDPDDVRIAFVTVNQWQRPGLSYELETLILQATHPPYNVKIPRES